MVKVTRVFEMIDIDDEVTGKDSNTHTFRTVESAREAVETWVSKYLASGWVQVAGDSIDTAVVLYDDCRVTWTLTPY